MKYEELSKSILCKKYHNMLARCSEEYWDKYDNSYRGTKICDEWLYNKYAFYDWVNDGQYYKIDGEREVHLDKDVLSQVKGYEEKIYSPDTCLFLPDRINTFLGSCRRNLKTGLPLYVEQIEYTEKYRIRNNKYGIVEVFDNWEDAWEEVRQHKEAEKIVMADEYYHKHLIPKKVYDAVMSYEIKL